MRVNGDVVAREDILPKRNSAEFGDGKNATASASTTVQASSRRRRIRPRFSRKNPSVVMSWPDAANADNSGIGDTT
jgi:hypothetical protein